MAVLRTAHPMKSEHIHTRLPSAGIILGMVLTCAPVALGQTANGKPDGPPTPVVSIPEARDWFMEGSYEKAIEAYATLSQQPANVPEAQHGLARCRMQIGLYDEAIAGLTEVGSERSAEWHYLLARLYRITGDYEDTLKHSLQAIRLDKRHAGARRLLGRTQELLGQRDDAIKTYEWFDRRLVAQRELPHDAASLTDMALGFLRYSVLTRTFLATRTKHVLTEMLQVAYERVDRSYWPARIAAADLLREKYNNDPDSGSLSDYMAALRINEHLPQAHAGIGEVMLEKWNFEEVERQVELALDINPNYGPAIHLLAKTRVVERRYEEAIKLCERALATNPNDLTALSINAAAHACRYDDDGAERMARRVDAINPRCALFHRTLGDALGGIRQYAASEKAYHKAIEFDPTDANAHTELGMMYMQWGEERKAHEVLEAAWGLDPFNQRTDFTLELLEKLGKFSQIETEHFIVKHDPQRDPGLGSFVAKYMEDIYDDVIGDYDTTLTDKTIIELFPTHRAFGVRITGKPWIYTIGASTGRVIALASPGDLASGMGPYDIARVLKHEFTHTVTLAATKNRIPHWFTEGLAVYQEDSPRPFAWVELLAGAARRDRLFTLKSIDWGFMRPRRPNDRQLAYAQSEWMCEYIVERFGYDLINTMISRYRQGQTQAHVFDEQLSVGMEQFDRDFRTWARKQVEGWGFDLTPPEDVSKLRELADDQDDNAALLGRLARAEFDDGDFERALNAARRALKLDKNQPNGLEVLGTVLAMSAREEGDEATRRMTEDEARPALRRLSKVDPGGWTAPRLLGEIALRREEYDEAIELLTRLQRLCPMDPTSWGGLGGIFLEKGDYDLALPQLTELARIEGHDPDVPAQIAKIHKRRGRLREAQYWYRRALRVDPFSVESHKALGDTYMQASDTALALDEYRMLTRLEPKKAAHFEHAAFAANKMGDKKEAQFLARKAVELDPSSSARSLLP